MNITYFNRILGIFAAVAALLISANAFAASDFLLEIEGIKGECKGKKFELTENADGSFTAENIPGGTYRLVCKPKVVIALSRQASGYATTDKPGDGPTTFTFKFEGVVSPRDVATGQSSGKRQHKPFTITKELDKMSPKGSSLGEIIVGDLDGDGSSDRGKVTNTNPPENAGKAPVKAGYDLKLNKKV